MKKAVVLSIITLITSCRFPASDETLNSLVGNRYYQSHGLHSSESIILGEDSTFEVKSYSTLSVDLSFSGVWYLRNDTLVLFKQKSNHKFSELEELTLKQILSTNSFDTLTFKVYSSGITMIRVDSISVIDSSYYYKLSR